VNAQQNSFNASAVCKCKGGWTGRNFREMVYSEFISQVMTLFSHLLSKCFVCETWVDRFTAQGQYWAGRTPRPNNGPPNMAAANFVVITLTEMGARLMEQPLPQCLSTNSVPHAFFPRVAIGCRLSLKIDRNLSPFWAGALSVATWYDTAWIGGTASG